MYLHKQCIERESDAIYETLRNSSISIDDYCWSSEELGSKAKTLIEDDLNSVTDSLYFMENDSFTQGPIFHCSEAIRNDSTFVVYYRWEFSRHRETLRILTQ